MDLLLENGDYKKDPSGKPISISGLDELMQRVYIRLKSKLGAFIYDRELGSDISELPENPNDNELLVTVRSALPQLFDAELLSAKREKDAFTAEFHSKLGDFSIIIPIEGEEE